MPDGAGNNLRSRFGEVWEVFSGLQGEGVYAGRRQVFVRFAGCNLDCPYCDTLPAFADRSSCRAERTPGGRDFETVPWPVSPAVAGNMVRRLLEGTVRHHSISLTGGEPLLHAEYIRSLLGSLEGAVPVHLETNGTLPERLETVLDLVDVVALDFKVFPGAAGLPYEERHRRFLSLAAGRDVFVKLVLTAGISDRQIAAVCRIIESVDVSIPLVLQPAAGFPAPPPDRVLDINTRCLSVVPNVLVLPQTHKIMGQL